MNDYNDNHLTKLIPDTVKSCVHPDDDSDNTHVETSAPTDEGNSEASENDPEVTGDSAPTITRNISTSTDSGTDDDESETTDSSTSDIWMGPTAH